MTDHPKIDDSINKISASITNINYNDNTIYSRIPPSMRCVGAIWLHFAHPGGDKSARKINRANLSAIQESDNDESKGETLSTPYISCNRPPYYGDLNARFCYKTSWIVDNTVMTSEWAGMSSFLVCVTLLTEMLVFLGTMQIKKAIPE